jgi:ParB-like chromosome segregation protein Spo0J
MSPRSPETGTAALRDSAQTLAQPAQMTVPIRSLLAGYTPRHSGEDAEHIQILAAAEAVLPPVLVHRQTMRVIDGMHRLRAALLKGQRAIEVQFFDGDEDEAFVLAVQANTTHGLALTLAEREAAAARIIASYPERSDRWIASITGLAAGTVARVRRAASRGDSLAVARLGRDGRVRPLNSADGRRIAAQAIAAHPGASLRDIARLAGISPATVRDVRERLRRGDDPVLPPRTKRSKETGSALLTRQVPGAERRGRAAPGPARDRASLLERLRKDPALRYTESGRALLAWLDARAGGPGPGRGLIGAAPPHCAYLVAELARYCASEWQELAAQVEQQLRCMAQPGAPGTATVGSHAQPLRRRQALIAGNERATA